MEEISLAIELWRKLTLVPPQQSEVGDYSSRGTRPLIKLRRERAETEIKNAGEILRPDNGFFCSFERSLLPIPVIFIPPYC